MPISRKTSTTPPAEETVDSSPSESPVKSGWNSYNKKKAESGGFAEQFKAPYDDEALIKFLDNEPVAVYDLHWIEKDGKKSFACLEDDCPMCERGDRPRLQVSFNIVVHEDGTWVNRVWTNGKRNVDLIHSKAKSLKNNSGLELSDTEAYFEVSRSGKGTQTVTSISAVKSRDVKDDWNTDVLTDEQVRKFKTKKYNADDIQRPSTRAEMAEVAESYLED